MVNPVANTASRLAEEVLSAVALVRENYGGAAEDHCSHGDVQQETEGGEKHPSSPMAGS